MPDTITAEVELTSGETVAVEVPAGSVALSTEWKAARRKSRGYVASEAAVLPGVDRRGRGGYID